MTANQGTLCPVKEAKPVPFSGKNDPNPLITLRATSQEYQALLKLRRISRTQDHAEVHFKGDGTINVYKVSKSLEKT